jgi:hypothetical protein
MITDATRIPEARTLRDGLLPRLAAVVVGLAVVLDLITFWAFAAGWSIHTPLGYGAELPALLATDFYGAIAAAVGLILAVRRPGNIIGLLLCATALGAASHMLTMYGAAMGIPRAFEPWSTAAAWLSGNLLQPSAAIMIATLMLLFPNGQLVTPRWRFAAILVALGASLRFVETAIAPGAILYFPAVQNPLAAPGELGRAASTVRSLNPGLWLLCLGMLAAAASLVIRYRTATREVRRQIGWYVLAGTAVVCTILPLMYLFLFVDQGAGVGQGA